MELLAFLLAIGALVIAWRKGKRLQHLEELVAELTRRVYLLETRKGIQESAESERRVPAVAAPEPPFETPKIEPLEEAAATALESEARPSYEPPSPPVTRPPFDISEPEPSRRSEEWEAVLGGSIFNKIAALVLVMGLGMLLSYSLERFGPAGKVATGAVFSLGLLGCGHWLERREKYRLFSIGLLGGGWAGLYVTAFAAHAIPAARVIANPTLGLFVLLGVAALMIAGCLRYRSEAVTGLTFLAAVLALQMDARSAPAAVAAIVLHAVLLVVSAKLEWKRLPLAGTVVLYAMYLWLVKPPPVIPGFGSPQLWAHWLLNTIYVLRGGPRPEILAANAGGFLGASLLAARGAPDWHLAPFLSLAAVAFVATGAAQWKKLPPAAETSETEFLWLGPGGAMLLGVLLGALAICRQYTGMWRALGLLWEAEMLVGLAYWKPRRALQWAAALMYGAAAAISLDVPQTTRTLGVLSAGAYAPLWIGAAGAGWLNRRLLAMPAFSWLAFVPLAAVVAMFGPDRVGAVAWCCAATALAAAARRVQWSEIEWQSYLMAFAGAAVFVLTSFRDETVWAVAQFLGAGSTFGTAALVSGAGEGPVRRWIRQGIGTLGTALLASAIWIAIPAALVAPAWGLAGLALVEFGKWRGIRNSTWWGFGLAVSGFVRVFLSNLTLETSTGFLSHRVLTAGPMVVLAYQLWDRLREERPVAARFCLWAAPAMALALIRFEFGRAQTGVAAAGLMLLFLHLGSRYGLADLRYQGYLLAGYSFFRSMGTTYYEGGVPLTDLVRIGSAMVVTAALFAAHRMTEESSGAARWIRPGLAVMGAALAGAVLYREISGKLLTIAWGMEGLGLLVIGFLWRERVLRLSGLGLFLFCVMKLIVYDLRTLEGLARIGSFIGLGLLLLGVSWLYTRFRDQIRRLL